EPTGNQNGMVRFETGCSAVVHANRNIQLSIKQKDMADEQGAMASLSQQSSRESAGTTSLGALLRAKLDNSEK
ncbi:hypothetical protein ACQKEU_26770, partial [Acidovorax sp. NPDC077664]|uniref:hypothetical protein n=1 Tax=Acidovorax sp. NPDC077664 TaxID=3390544 RepID=UPI003D024EA7